MQITVIVDTVSQAYLQRLRTKYYPKHLNKTDAHITLIYKIEDTLLEIIEAIKEFGKTFRALDIAVIGVRQTKTGNQLLLESSELLSLHQRVIEIINTHVFKKDKIPFVPHCTIQNGVTPFKALRSNKLIQDECAIINMKAIGIAFNTIEKGKVVDIENVLFQNL